MMFLKERSEWELILFLIFLIFKSVKQFPEVREIFLDSSPLVNRVVACPWQFKVFQGLPNCTKGKSQGFFGRTFYSGDGVFKKIEQIVSKWTKKTVHFNI